MEIIQKIELVIVGLLLVFHVLFLVSNPNIISDVLGLEDEEIKAPSDFISEDKILTYPNRVVIELEDYTISRYAPTGSMIPVLDSGANGIGIKPRSEEDLSVGDIITFEQGDDLIVHRIIEEGLDEEGWYCITKGDNNTVSDGKIRFEQIDTVLVALIY